MCAGHIHERFDKVKEIGHDLHSLLLGPKHSKQLESQGKQELLSLNWLILQKQEPSSKFILF